MADHDNPHQKSKWAAGKTHFLKPVSWKNLVKGKPKKPMNWESLNAMSWDDLLQPKIDEAEKVSWDDLADDDQKK